METINKIYHKVFKCWFCCLNTYHWKLIEVKLAQMWPLLIYTVIIYGPINLTKYLKAAMEVGYYSKMDLNCCHSHFAGFNQKFLSVI